MRVAGPGELERVEVLKGPQGTLFGKTTSAGLINIVTVGPSDVTDYGAEITAGDRGVRAASAFITGPLGDDLAGRL